MFPPLGRRARLTRRLLKAAGAGGAGEARLLLHGLSRAALEALLAAVASGGAEGGCVPAPPAPAPAPAPAPPLAACRAWRWPELRASAELRPLPGCRRAACLNPYHWSRLCKPESPPPPYCRFAMDDNLKPEDRAPSEDSRRTDHERPQPGSLTTDGEGKLGGGREWCRLAYWELAARVGRQFSVELPAMDVFSGLSHGSGLCLDTLARGALAHPHPVHLPLHADQVAKTRAKIGLGVTLSTEPDGVWVYNRSEQPIFVNSPTLDDSETRSLLVYRVPPGHCLCVHRPGATAPPPAAAPLGPVDPRSVRISFAKGWGPKYSRRDVTACPCWLEVLLAPCR